MTLPDALLLALAALGAGMVNSMGGGGTLISFPALLALGYGARVANVTNTVGIWPGLISGSLAYRKELSRQPENIRMAVIPVAAGSLLGAAILLTTPSSIFRSFVPFLLLGACALFAAQDRIVAFVTKHRAADTPRFPTIAVQIAIFVAAIYGGYFGAGIGIILLTCFGLLLPDDIQRSNALRGVVSAIVNFFAVVSFVFFGHVAWGAAAIMAVAAVAGGYAGVAVARRLSRDRLRLFVISYGTVAALALFFR